MSAKDKAIARFNASGLSEYVDLLTTYEWSTSQETYTWLATADLAEVRKWCEDERAGIAEVRKADSGELRREQDARTLAAIRRMQR